VRQIRPTHILTFAFAVTHPFHHDVIGSVMVGHDSRREWLYYVAVDPTCRSMNGPCLWCSTAWVTQKGRKQLRQSGLHYSSVAVESPPLLAAWNWRSLNQRL